MTRYKPSEIILGILPILIGAVGLVLFAEYALLIGFNPAILPEGSKAERLWDFWRDWCEYY